MQWKRQGFRIGGAFAALTALNLAGQFAGAAGYNMATGSDRIPLWMTWVLSFLPLYGLAFPVFYTLLQRLPRVPLVRRKVSIGQFCVTACMAMCLMYVGSITGNLINLGIGALRGAAAESALEQLVTAAPLWQTLLFACLLAPIGEELIFNTLLHCALPFGEKQAILFTALTFGLFHGNLYQFFYAFLVRLVLSQLYLASGRMAPCMLLHGVINVLGSAAGQLVLDAGEKATAAYGLTLILVAVLGGMLLRRRWGRAHRAAPRPDAAARWLFASTGALFAFTACIVMTVLALF